MKRQTAEEVLKTNDSKQIHPWLETASFNELQVALRLVRRHSTWGSHTRDALDIRIARNSQKIAWLVLLLTLIAAVGAVIQAYGVWWMIYRSNH